VNSNKDQAQDPSRQKKAHRMTSSSSVPQGLKPDYIFNHLRHPSTSLRAGSKTKVVPFQSKGKKSSFSASYEAVP
jgi:hypothetical protein